MKTGAYSVHGSTIRQSKKHVVNHSFRVVRKNRSRGSGLAWIRRGRKQSIAAATAAAAAAAVMAATTMMAATTATTTTLIIIITTAAATTFGNVGRTRTVITKILRPITGTTTVGNTRSKHGILLAENIGTMPGTVHPGGHHRLARSVPEGDVLADIDPIKSGLLNAITGAGTAATGMRHFIYTCLILGVFLGGFRKGAVEAEGR